MEGRGETCGTWWPGESGTKIFSWDRDQDQSCFSQDKGLKGQRDVSLTGIH